ncbi:BamA/TamA family outer membrane protein [candidate division KSB1 bacterium]|nr:BamA/TamA family outer membrane protein [candidate division KSB1 bacterium]
MFKKSIKNIVPIIVIIFLLCDFPTVFAASDNLILKKINFTGNKTFPAKTLKKIIQSHGGSFFSQFLFWKEDNYFNENFLQDDINRLVDFYQTEGFTNVRISTLRDIDQQKNNIVITFEIIENNPVIVNTVNFQLLPEDGDVNPANSLITKIKPKLNLITGGRFRDDYFTRDKEIIINHFTNSGYPHIELVTDLNVSENNVQIFYKIKTGPYCTFGPVNISGNRKIPSEKIKKQLAFTNNDYFNQELLQDTQRRIFALGVFQYVSVNAVLDSNSHHIIPIEIRLKESPRFRTKIGVGYGKEDKFRISADILKLGFLGNTRRINFYARHSFLEPYNFSIKYIFPAFPGPNTTMTIEPFLKKEREPGYKIRRIGGNVSFQKKISTYTDGFINYSLEQDNLFVSKQSIDEALNKRDISLYNKSGITLGLIRDTSLPLFTPVKGLYTSATLTLSGLGFQSDYHFYRILLETRKYHRLNNSLVWATKFKIGLIEPTHLDEVTPIEERFYAGGSNSIRGWRRSDIGPKNSNGEPIGGNSYLESSLELRYPIWQKLSGVLFMDLGNVWSKKFDYNLYKLHYAAGTGLRLSTPIGLIRFDVSAPVFERKHKLQFHISAGQAF